MTAAFMRREEIARRRTRAKWTLYVLEKWPYLLHHIFVATGYPIIVVSLTLFSKKRFLTSLFPATEQPLERVQR